jgi:hypothetical protein
MATLAVAMLHVGQPLLYVFLQFARGSAAHAGGWRNAGRDDGDDIANAHLHLVVAHSGMVVLCEEHEQVMRDHVGIIGMVGESHLPDDRFLGGSDSHFLAIVPHNQLARFLAHRAVGPEHQGDDAPLDVLFAEALADVVGQLAYSGAGFIGIGGVMETHARVLAHRRRVRHNQADIFAIRQVEKPASELSQAAA